jgi:hypothetical protein
MKPSDVLRTLQEQRRFWVECGDDGVAIQMRRALYAELAAMSGRGDVDIVLSHVVGWRGVTARHIVGAAGDDDALEFDAELAQAWLRDEPELLRKLLEAFVAQVERAGKARADAGNA